MKKNLLVIFFVSMFFVLDLFADDFDLFDKMEETKMETLKEKTIFEKISEVADFTLMFKYYHFLSDFTDSTGEKDKRKDFASVLFEPKLKYNYKNTIFNFRGWIESGNEKDTYKGYNKEFYDNSRHKRYFQLAEINFIISLDNFELTLGKKDIKVGVATLYSPAERYKIIEGNDPVDLKEIGMWQIRGDYFKNDITYTFIFLPVFNESKVPSPYTRWSGEEDNSSTSTEFEGVKEDDIYKDIVNIRPENFSYLSKIKAVVKGWDIFATLYYGVSPYSVLREDDNNSDKYYREHPMILSTSSGFSTTYKKFEIHGETHLQYSPQGKDDTFINYIVGSTYTLDEWVQYIWIDRIDATIEYAGEEIINDQYAKNYKRSSVDQRAGRNNILGRFNAKVNEKFNFEWYFTRNFDDKGFMHRYGAIYKFKSGITLKAFFDFFDGPKDSYFGKWRKNDRFISFIEYKF
ncbi:MAG: hypothetical protein K6348_09595 [Deferribacterales bacterium]